MESLPKNLIAAHPVQGSQADEGSGGTCSPAAPCAQRYGTGKAKGRLRCGLSEAKGKGRGLTEDFRFYACGREREPVEEFRSQRHGETVTGAINSPPPSRRETPIIMWIKWQNLAKPARPPTSPWHGPAGGGGACVRVALLCSFLNFSIKMDNFQSNKLSKRSVKIPYGIKACNT